MGNEPKSIVSNSSEKTGSERNRRLDTRIQAVHGIVADVLITGIGVVSPRYGWWESTSSQDRTAISLPSIHSRSSFTHSSHAWVTIYPSLLLRPPTLTAHSCIDHATKVGNALITLSHSDGVDLYTMISKKFVTNASMCYIIWLTWTAYTQSVGQSFTLSKYSVAGRKGKGRQSGDRGEIWAWSRHELGE